MLKGDDLLTQAEERKELENTVIEITKNQCSNISSSENMEQLEQNLMSLSNQIARKSHSKIYSLAHYN